MKNVIDFLKDLSANNSKEWMDAHRNEYQEAKTTFIALVDRLLKRLAEHEPWAADLEGRKCVFRINRDIRFSADKSPYKINFGAAISEGGRHSENPSYYLHIQPGGHFAGGGIYMPPAEMLKKIRQEIDYNPEPLKAVAENSAFKAAFGAIQGESLKKAPKGYPVDHPNIDLLRLKSFVVLKSFSDTEVASENFENDVFNCFLTMKPFHDYLAVAVS